MTRSQVTISRRFLISRGVDQLLWEVEAHVQAKD